MTKARWVVLSALAFCIGFCSGCANGAQEAGLAAYYAFDAGRGTVLKDSSGHGNHGAIHGASWREVPGGYALGFDGIDDYVDCGNPPALDIRGPITLMAWLCPAGLQPAKEPGIVGKQFSSYLMTYYLNRLCFWYINSGGNNTFATLLPGTWSHVAATFDGKFLRIYVNGKLARTSRPHPGPINQGNNFLIGALSGDPTAADPNYRASGAFKGMIDEVKVYGRALSDEDIGAQYHSAADRNGMFAVACVPVSDGERIRSGDISVIAGKGGAVQISRGKSFCVIESRFSYPGKQIGYNALAEQAEGGEQGWKPNVKRTHDGALLIEASGAHYALKRVVRVRDARVEFADTLTSRSDTPVGVIITHRIIAPGTLSNARIGTTADNPTVFFSQPDCDFGFLAEDDIARLQFEASSIFNNATVRHSAFALDTAKSHTFRYALYPLKPTGDVFDFINRVRSDWNVNFTVEGRWAGVARLLHDRKAIKRFIERRQLQVTEGVGCALDYDPGYGDHVLTRDEFKAASEKANKVIRDIAPGIKTSAMIECDWVTIYPEKIKDGHLIVNGTQEELTRVIDAANLPWKDSVKRDKNGHLSIERYTRAGKPQFALAVYPAPGNYQHEFLLEQAKFLIDEVGLEAIYIDEFSQAWSQSIRSYEGWDGVSADIDPATGRIRRKFVNCGLVGIRSRVEFINYVLSRGKVLYANTYATSRAEQSLPVNRFWEMQSYLDLDGVETGKEPPLVFEMCQGVLGSPLGLGVTAVPGKSKAEGLMLGMMSYLRHGLLYVHYWYPDLPETGPGSGEYGPINHMYPMTPVELHKGWIKGKERIIGCVSFETTWDMPRRPKVIFFDLTGRQKQAPGKVRVAGERGNWQVSAELDDWREFVVLE